MTTGHTYVYMYTLLPALLEKKMYTNMYVDIATKYKKKQLYRYMYVLCAYCDQYQGKLWKKLKFDCAQM